MLQEKEIIWLAGLFEGEATFFPQTNRYPLGLGIEMTDEDIIQKVSKLLEVSYCAPTKRVAHHKQSYKLNYRGLPALTLMLQLLPHMGKRRSERINECLKSYLKKQVGKINSEQLREIELRVLNGEKVKEVAKDYPVSFWRVYQIARAARITAIT